MTTPESPSGDELPDSDAVNRAVDKRIAKVALEMLDDIGKRMMLDPDWAPNSLDDVRAGAPSHEPLEDSFLEAIAEGYTYEEIQEMTRDQDDTPGE